MGGLHVQNLPMFIAEHLSSICKRRRKRLGLGRGCSSSPCRVAFLVYLWHAWAMPRPMAQERATKATSEAEARHLITDGWHLM